MEIVGIDFIFKLIFISMKAFEKYLNSSNGLQRIGEIYLKIRQYFQKEGWSEKDLESPPYYSSELMSLYQEFGVERRNLYNQTNDFFGVSEDDFKNFITPILEKINEITPLNDGDYKRGNQGDEDY
jgi:hypothetical protein